jgi:hypothetical protein
LLGIFWYFRIFEFLDVRRAKLEINQSITVVEKLGFKKKIGTLQERGRVEETRLGVH